MANRKRSIQLKFFANDAEKAVIDRKIFISKYKKTEYLRNMALNGVVTIKKIKEADFLKSELNKTGKIINSIVKHIHQMGEVSDSDLDYINKCLDDLQERIVLKIF